MSSLPDKSKHVSRRTASDTASSKEMDSSKSFKSVRSRRSSTSSSTSTCSSRRRATLLAQQQIAEIEAKYELDNIELIEKEQAIEIERKKRAISAELAKKKVEIQANLDGDDDESCSNCSSFRSSRISKSKSKRKTQHDDGKCDGPGTHRYITSTPAPVKGLDPKGLFESKISELNPLAPTFNVERESINTSKGLDLLQQSVIAMQEQTKLSRLPPLTLPTFNGDITEFIEFKQAFVFNIEQNVTQEKRPFSAMV